MQEYHARADRLLLIPATAKRAEGIQFEIKVNRAGVTANELVNVDLKATIKPALQRIRDAYVTRARLLNEELLSLAEKLDASQEHVTERAEDNAVLEQRVCAGGGSDHPVCTHTLHRSASWMCRCAKPKR